MGNTESNVSSGVKKQAGASIHPIYKLCNLKGEGLLVELMKRAARNKQYAEVDHAIKTKVEPLLYNKGRGRYILKTQLVLNRNKERPKHKLLPPLKSMENPEEFEIDDEGPEVTEEEFRKNPSLYRYTCWKVKDRGAVGETLLHLCLLNATALHDDIAKRILRFYPNVINDIYLSDEYYGENVLHVAVVNEDPSMVKYLLEAGADFTERCYGDFWCPEDQKSSRHDSLDQEVVLVCHESNYAGYVYWGEYALTIAACIGQEECYRLILAKGADPNVQDTNGNTALHLLVLYEKMDAFNMCYEVGAQLAFKNILNLTPLTLAAKLARVNMFYHILKLEREIYWQIGSITCAAYPLSQIDTIDNQTGHISVKSVLNLVVFGDKDEHLELMDGVVVDLLNAKWNTFVKKKFYSPLVSKSATAAVNGTAHKMVNKSLRADILNFTLNISESLKLENNTSLFHAPSKSLNSTESDSDLEEWWSNLKEDCRLMQLDSGESKIRILTEVIVLFCAFLYLASAVIEARFLGLIMFFENLMTAPSRVMFLFSCILMQIVPFLRLACDDESEDAIVVIIMLTTAPYFLFFCRGFKTVGPFVVMIYRMVMGDLLRFAAIYMVFVMGFSQAFYIIFLSYDNPLTPDEVDDSATNPMATPIECITAMFLMSLTNFGDYYEAFEKTEHEYVAKNISILYTKGLNCIINPECEVLPTTLSQAKLARGINIQLSPELLFVIYMVIVAILLINMLIAMMGNTYQKIAETRNEWQRQWARIVLVVERGVNPAERLKQMMVYSQPMAGGERALVLRLNQSDEDKEELKEILEIKRRHVRNIKKREQQQTEQKIEMKTKIIIK